MSTAPLAIAPRVRTGSSGRQWSITAAIVAILLLMAFTAPAFFRPEHLRDKLVANAPVLVAALGMTFVILARQIDISIGSQLSVCSVLCALAAQHNWPLPAVIATAILSGAAMGLFNGVMVAYV